MNVAVLHRRSCETMLAGVRPDQWSGPTPCTDWDVHTLVNHVVAEDLWTAALFGGTTIAEVGDRFDGDVVGDDPVAAYRRAAAAAIAAVSAAGALTRTVQLSGGETPGEEYAWQLFTDHLIHGWDLATAIGADDRLEPDLVARCAAWFAEREAGYRASGMIGPWPQLPPDADPQTVLLAAFGRLAARVAA